MEKKGQKRNKKNDLERKVEKLQLTADDRETRGFISMICTSQSAGLTAICTLEPPHSTPISRMMATEASRRRWYSCGWLCVGGSEEFVFFQREKERAGELFELFFFLFSFSFHPFHFPLSLSLSPYLVSQRLRRGHRDRVPGVHAHGVEVLDRADDHDVVGEVLFLKKVFFSFFFRRRRVFSFEQIGRENATFRPRCPRNKQKKLPLPH